MCRWGFGLTIKPCWGAGSWTTSSLPSMSSVFGWGCFQGTTPSLTCMAKRKQLGGEGQSPQEELQHLFHLKAPSVRGAKTRASCDGSPRFTDEASVQGPVP